MNRPPVLSGVVTQNVSPEEVYNVMCDAASQDPAKVKTSSQRLKEMLEMAGTFDALSEIAAQRTVPLQVRQQSAIQLKNAVQSHWRSRRLTTDEQRTHIRARCLMLLDEPDDLIFECNELITAKIARQDLPLKWANLIPDLMNVINTNMTTRHNGAPTDLLSLCRSLELLNAIMKELFSAKILTGLSIAAQLVEQTHMILQNHYSTAAAPLALLNPASISTPRGAEDILLAHLIFKCLVKCAVWAWQKMKSPTDKAKVDPWLRELFQNSALQLQTLSELRVNLVLALRNRSAISNSSSNQAILNLTRHVFLFGKLFRREQQLDSARFVSQPTCSNLIFYYWNKVVQATNSPPDYIEDAPTAVFPVRFLVQGMTLFRDSLAQWAPARKDGGTSETVVSQQFVEDAVKLLVTRFIPLNPSDLEEWMADPEEWVNIEEKDNEQWQFSLRPCGERVLLSLSNQWPDFVVPLLSETWKQMRAQPMTDLPSILQKEALYCALGRCCLKLKGVIPFEEWLVTNLAPEARETNPSFPIIKRRIAWLIGKWISSQCSSPKNPVMWETLVHLLQDRGPGTDAVVRLTAAVAIRECVDTVEFDVNVFAPYLPSVVAELIRLSAEADTLESKCRISNSLNAVIERAETRIVPFMGSIAEPIPQLWVAAGEDWLFKASLLVTVTRLIEATKEHSTTLCGLVVPLVRESFTPLAAIQLDEDGLHLWQAAIRNTTTIDSVNGNPGLYELLPLAVSLLANNLDLLGQITDIVESYFLLDAPRVVQGYAVDIFRAMKQCMEQAFPINVKGVTTALNLLLQLAPSSLWGEALHVSGLFAHIVKTFYEDKATTEVLTTYIYTMARIAIVDKQLFLQLMSATPSVLNLPETDLYTVVLNQWWTRFDNMYEPQHRKLAAMGIASLVSTGRHDVLDRLSTEIFNLWLDVFGEIKEAQNRAETEGASSLTLYWDKQLDDVFPDSQGTPELERCKAAYDNDPVRTTQLTSYIAARLQEAELACGGSATLQANYLAKTDPTVLEQIQRELIGQQ